MLRQTRERGVFALSSRSAVVVIANDPARTGLRRPLQLQLVMGTPLLRWLTHALAQRGVERWLLVCQERWLSEAKHCFPAGARLTACADREAGNPLHVFLSSAGEDEREVLVITGPCACLPDDGIEPCDCACCVDPAALMTALDEPEFSITHFLQTCGSDCAQLRGVQAVHDAGELVELSDRMRRATLRGLADRGVQIWDPDHCHVDPGVSVGAGSVLMPGAILRGDTRVGNDCVIGPDALLENAELGSGCRINASQLSDCRLGSDCAVGPYACIRSGSRLGARVRVGAGAELCAADLGEAARVGAQCVLRELTCGRGCTFGPGVICAAGAPEASGPVTLGDDCAVGGGVILAGPVDVGRCAAVSAGSVVTANVPAQALAGARARQTVRRDWALHKKS